MMSRSAVCAAQLTALRVALHLERGLLGVDTIQKSTASTLTGTVSEVSVCSAAKPVVMTR